MLAPRNNDFYGILFETNQFPGKLNKRFLPILTLLKRIILDFGKWEEA